MIEFFRDFLDGPLYIVVVILSVFFIMAIIGYLMEKKKLEKEKNDQIAVVSTPEVTPIEPVSVENNEVTTEAVPISEIRNDSEMEVKTPVIVFEDPDEKKE